jgi:hypothetical protein
MSFPRFRCLQPVIKPHPSVSFPRTSSRGQRGAQSLLHPAYVRVFTRAMNLANVIILDIGLSSHLRLQSASPGRHAQYTFCQAETSSLEP